MLKPWSRYLLYPALLPTDIVATIFVGLLRLAWGDYFRWENGALVMEFAKDSWPSRSVYKGWLGTTLGHVIVLNKPASPEARQRTLVHERDHMEAHETNALVGLVAALLIVWASWPIALAVWALMPWLVYTAGYITAVCYGGNAYRDNPAEVAAVDRERITEG